MSLLLLLSAAALAADTTTYTDNSPDCKCYAVSTSSTPEYFTNHRFFDFRYVLPTDQYTTPPPLITGDSSTGAEQTRDQTYLNSTDFNNDWSIMGWGKKVTDDSPIRMQNSAQNVFVRRTTARDADAVEDTATTFLTLRTARLSKGLQTAAEVESEHKNLMHASIRLRMRVSANASAGAVAGLFTYMDDTNESDFEILTADPNSTWRLTNQPSVDKKGDDIPAASLTKTGLPSWREWRTLRLDWLPKISEWYVDGKLVGQSTYSVPRKPSAFIMNMWGDGGVWSSEMPVGGQAELQIQWIQMVFNTSGPRSGPGTKHNGKRDGLSSGLEKRKTKACGTVCAIDGVQRLGWPEVKFTSGAAVVKSTGYIVGLVGVLSFCLLLA